MNSTPEVTAECTSFERLQKWVQDNVLVLRILTSTVDPGCLKKSQELGLNWFAQVDEQGRIALKIRTMRMDAQREFAQVLDSTEQDGHGAIHDDYRVRSSFFALLRQTGLDETPQLVQWATGLVTGKKMPSLLGNRILVPETMDALGLTKEDREELLSSSYGIIPPIYSLPKDATEEDKRRRMLAYTRVRNRRGKVAAYTMFGKRVLPNVMRRVTSAFRK
jgi:Bacterial sugar transferase